MAEATPTPLPVEIRDVCQRIVEGTIAPREGALEVLRIVGPDLTAVDDHPLWHEVREFYSVADQWVDSEELSNHRGEEMPPDLIQTYERWIVADAQRIIEGRQPKRLM